MLRFLDSKAPHVSRQQPRSWMREAWAAILEDRRGRREAGRPGGAVGESTVWGHVQKEEKEPSPPGSGVEC